jgi:NADPH-dependent ferric siderophore reductase
MSTTSISPLAPPPRIERVRHELKRRTLTVSTLERITPAMLRVTLTGEDLHDFTSLSPDDHIKIMVPQDGGEEQRRDYTPRRFDAASRMLVIDFALHDAGPATRWALDARVGSLLDIGGPRGSAVIAPDVRNWLLIGDETALPAIGRRIEELPSDARVTSLVSVAGPQEHQVFKTPATLTCRWAYRPLSAADDPAALLDALETVTIAPDTFVWIAAEASVTRALRARIEAGGLPQGWLKAAGYWVMGKADTSETIA